MIIFYNKKVMRYNIYHSFIINFVTATSDYIFSYKVFLISSYSIEGNEQRSSLKFFNTN